MLFDQNVSSEIAKLKEAHIRKYVKKVEKLFEDVKDLKTWEQNETAFHEKILNIFLNEIKKNGIFYHKKTFIEKIIKEDGELILLNIDQKFQTIQKVVFRDFISKVIEKIGERNFQDIMNVIPEEYLSELEKEDENISPANIANMLTRFGFISPQNHNPMPITSIFNIQSLSYGTFSKIGVFFYKNSLNELMDLTCKLLNGRKTKLMENLETQANFIFHKVVEKISSYRTISEELRNQKQLILEFKKTMKRPNYVSELDETDTFVIWKKVQIQQLFVDDYLKKNLKNILYKNEEKL